MLELFVTAVLLGLGIHVWREAPAAGSMVPEPLDSPGFGVAMLIDYKVWAWNWNFLGFQVPGCTV